MSEELIEVLDAEGRSTGLRKPKWQVHRDGDWHRSAHLWLITPDGELLLQRRSALKENHPGLWDVSVAGHISAGESAVQSAVREAEEELGLNLSPEQLTHLTTLRQSCRLNGGRYLDHEFHEIFVTRLRIDPAALRLQPGEVDDVALVSPADLPNYELVPHPGEYELIAAFVS